VLEDVTQQKLASDAQHESEARRAASVEAALDCIISMDSDGIISEWNPSAENTFGYSREEALGRPLAELIVPPSLREKHARGLKRYLESGESILIGRKVEVPAMRASGEEFPVELAIKPILLGDRQIFSGFLRDLTEIKAARDALQEAHDELENRVVQRTLELRAALEQLQTKHEQLEQLETLRDTLTGMIVHDLRTPLSSMLFGVQTVAFLGGVNPAQQECLNVFALGCKDSLTVINDLLDIGKIESSYARRDASEH
jgi:PAS domain S-box-containing protein